MENKANIRIELDPSCQAPEVLIRTDRKTAYIDRIIAAIESCSEDETQRITVYRGDTASLIEQGDILRAYTEARKIAVCAVTGRYELRCTLRELEEKLNAKTFVRISRFEIINLNRISGFDLSMAGTIKVIFEDGSSTWVARRYVHSIQQKLRRTTHAEEARA